MQHAIEIGSSCNCQVSQRGAETYLGDVENRYGACV